MEVWNYNHEDKDDWDRTLQWVRSNCKEALCRDCSAMVTSRGRRRILLIDQHQARLNGFGTTSTSAQFLREHWPSDLQQEVASGYLPGGPQKRSKLNWTVWVKAPPQFARIGLSAEDIIEATRFRAKRKKTTMGVAIEELLAMRAPKRCEDVQHLIGVAVARGLGASNL